MAEINDFGFTAVDQDELKTKTGEDASIGKEVADQLKAVAASSIILILVQFLVFSDTKKLSP